jgi:hypothetical protein
MEYMPDFLRENPSWPCALKSARADWRWNSIHRPNKAPIALGILRRASTEVRPSDIEKGGYFSGEGMKARDNRDKKFSFKFLVAI